VFSADRNGAINWEAWIKVPYSGLLHDFAITQKHVVFFMVPLVTHMDKIRDLGLHYVWDGTLPSYVGVLRRGGDGSDVRWFQAPQLFCDHTMGSWADGDKVTIEMDGREGNRYPFFDSLQGPTPEAREQIHRFTMDLRSRSRPAHRFVPRVAVVWHVRTTAIIRPYRYGFMNGFGPGFALDHGRSRGTTKNFMLPDYSFSEMCFVPRREGHRKAWLSDRHR
jgi:carotenoid cleavage dioxygenase